MLTTLGKQLRMIRLNSGDLLKDMAKKLEITPAYLSIIENGKRTPPRNIASRVGEIYHLPQSEKDALLDAYHLALGEVTISLNNTSSRQKELGLVFARRFNNLTEDEIIRILNTLNHSRGDGNRDRCLNQEYTNLAVR